MLHPAVGRTDIEQPHDPLRNQSTECRSDQPERHHERDPAGDGQQGTDDPVPNEGAVGLVGVQHARYDQGQCRPDRCKAEDSRSRAPVGKLLTEYPSHRLGRRRCRDQAGRN